MAVGWPNCVPSRRSCEVSNVEARDPSVEPLAHFLASPSLCCITVNMGYPLSKSIWQAERGNTFPPCFTLFNWLQIRYGMFWQSTHKVRYPHFCHSPDQRHRSMNALEKQAPLPPFAVPNALPNAANRRWREPSRSNGEWYPVFFSLADRHSVEERRALHDASRDGAIIATKELRENPSRV